MADRVAHDESLSVIRAQQGGQHRNGGRLSRPVGAKQAKNFALLHLEADALYRFEVAKRFIQIVDLNGRLHCNSSITRRATRRAETLHIFIRCWEDFVARSLIATGARPRAFSGSRMVISDTPTP